MLRKRYGNRIDVTWIPCECTNSIIRMFVAVNLFSFCAMLPLRVMCEWTLVIITDTNAMCNCLLFAQRVFYNINHERYFLNYLNWCNLYLSFRAEGAKKKSGPATVYFEYFCLKTAVFQNCSLFLQYPPEGRPIICECKTWNQLRAALLNPDTFYNVPHQSPRSNVWRF